MKAKGKEKKGSFALVMEKKEKMIHVQDQNVERENGRHTPTFAQNGNKVVVVGCLIDIHEIT